MNDNIVYFILDTYSNSVKIGYTTIKGLSKRLETLQIGTPYELRLLGALWGDRLTEKQIHKQFNYSHIRGEWFNYSKELEDFICSIQNDEYVPVGTTLNDAVEVWRLIAEVYSK